MTIKEYIQKAEYDQHGQRITGPWPICDVRGWGAIQNLFCKDGVIDLDAAEKFQDEMGQFITDAINEKLERTPL